MRYTEEGMRGRGEWCGMRYTEEGVTGVRGRGGVVWDEVHRGG